MLREVKNVRQHPDELLRRWFDDDEGFFELIAWVDDEETVTGFQLSYDVRGDERAITWLGGLFTHRDVDAGDNSPLSNDSAVLGPAIAYPINDIIRRFETGSQKIDARVRERILQQLVEFADQSQTDTNG